MAQAQHLFGTVGPDVPPGGDDATDARSDRNAAPRFADAEAIDLTFAQRVDQQRRRYHHQSHVLVGIDAAGREPIAQQVVMARKRIDHRQHQRRCARTRPSRTTRCRARPCVRGSRPRVDPRHASRHAAPSIPRSRCHPVPTPPARSSAPAGDRCPATTPRPSGPACARPAIARRSVGRGCWPRRSRAAAAGRCPRRRRTRTRAAATSAAQSSSGMKPATMRGTAHEDLGAGARSSSAAVTTLCATSPSSDCCPSPTCAAVRRPALRALALFMKMPLARSTSLRSSRPAASCRARRASLLKALKRLMQGRARLDALLAQAIDHVGAHASLHRRLDHRAVGAVDEHRHRPWISVRPGTSARARRGSDSRGR